MQVASLRVNRNNLIVLKLSHLAQPEQCDQIWQNFTTLAKVYKYFANF